MSQKDGAPTPSNPPGPTLEMALQAVSDTLAYHDRRIPKRIRRLDALSRGEEPPVFGDEETTGVIEIPDELVLPDPFPSDKPSRH